MNENFNKYKKHILSLCGVDCNLFDVRLKKFVYGSGFCESCPRYPDHINTHLYGCYEAHRWGDKYIYYCPRGLIFIAIAISGELNIMDYGIIAGPILMGEPEDEQKELLNILPNISAKNVNDLAELILPVFCTTVQFDRQFEHMHTKDFLNDVYKVIDMQKSEYPVNLENELRESVINGDKKHAKEALNMLLGHIFFDSAGSLDKIKERVIELIVQLSRFSIEGGAEISQIFLLNHNCLKEVESFKNIEQLSVWLSSIMNQYIGYTFEFQDVKHADSIYKVEQYIKENYMKKITLNDIANHVYLSKAYLSKIFKEETGITLVNYINELRIKKSKTLLKDHSLSLADIAALTGFDDQSYFSKVFKSITGISPGKYREKAAAKSSKT